MPYAIAIRANPKANAIPKKPTFSPATTAVPQPKNTNVKVPMNSAKHFFIKLSPFKLFFYTPAKTLLHLQTSRSLRSKGKCNDIILVSSEIRNPQSKLNTQN
jgi:hypothetical protein